MKKTVKLFSGLALVAAIAFFGFSSFDTPVVDDKPVVEQAPVVEDDDCGCPPGWELWDYRPKNEGGDGGGLDSENLERYDVNGDDKLCVKYLYDKGNGKAVGNTKTGWEGKVWKDNNGKCKD